MGSPVGFYLPQEAGYPIDPSSNRFYLMETHYNNPFYSSMEQMSSISGTGATMVDSSGLRLYYTPILRKHDAGVLSVGMEPNWRHIIPPAQKAVISEAHCVSDCTKRALPQNGISVFAVIMRTHMIGRRVRLRQIRRGTEQPPISADGNLDFDYQEYRRLGSPVRVLPGDHLIAECTYDSSERAAITLGGLTTREETCLVFALYYPRQKELTSCHSLPSLPTVLHSLGIQELHSGSNPIRIARPPELAGMTLESRLVSYDWENQLDSFQEATRRGSFKPLCWTSKPSLLPGTENLESHYPNITRPYIAPDSCGRVTSSIPGAAVLLDDNHIEGAARSKVSRSSAGQQGETLGLSSSDKVRTRWQYVAAIVLTVFLVL
ncbi:MOXD1 homolog 2-like [Ctenocephalides felis]|uniref:MOXD1 homolog 2-like n=1 Tax=Ctenocephalides felis TaxID=7515 RepID=UPI000E6E4650|nr:MOXD1 homolog 2-like [Ctenocephalides felis]